MPAMIDVQCPKCNRRFGWYGTMANRPPCPRCQYRPPQEELDAADARMEAFHERLRTNPLAASAEVRRQQRLDAGLGLRQAAKLLGVHPVELSQIERGEKEPSAELAGRMVEVYGLDVEEPKP